VSLRRSTSVLFPDPMFPSIDTIRAMVAAFV